MLNRRILRVKAMQALYGYFTVMESLKEVSKESLELSFSLDPAKHDFSDKPLFEERKKQAIRLFNQNYGSAEIQTSEKVDQEILESVNQEITNYTNRLHKEYLNRKKELTKEVDGIYDAYLKFLLLPIEIEHREKLEQEKKKNEGKFFPFIDQESVGILKSHEAEISKKAKSSIVWNQEEEEIKTWYRNQIRTAESLQSYFESGESTKELVLDLFKKVIFKDTMLKEHWETKYLYWSENQSIVKSLVLKSIKSITDEGVFLLADLTKNGKEDFDFLVQLYDGVIDQNEFLDQLISQKTKNWDVERIAISDLIILKLALVEMMTCRSIPVKVSINEAIEIAKQYSTPKSKQFINGVLDVLSNELTSMGKVRKTGRGLIDNK